MSRKFTPEPNGTRFGRWVIVNNDAGFNRHRMRLADARCDGCGEVHRVILANLRSGVSRQCLQCGGFESRPGLIKLTTDQAAQIKARLALGHRLVDIARDFRCSANAVSNIKHGRTYKQVKPCQ